MRSEVFNRAALLCGSLWRCQEIIDEVQRGLDATREARERAAERNELAKIRAMCAAHYGKSLSSVLADFSSGKLMAPKEKQYHNNEVSDNCYQQKPSQTALSGNALHKGFENGQNKSTNRNASKNGYINGSTKYRPSDGPLCFGCGIVGHIKPKCQNLQLQNWEQSCLKSIIYDRVPQFGESNMTYAIQDQFSEAQNTARRHLNPHYDLHCTSKEYQLPHYQSQDHHHLESRKNIPYNYNDNYQSTRRDQNRDNQSPDQGKINIQTQRYVHETDRELRNEPLKVHFEDQKDADCSLDQFARLNTSNNTSSGNMQSNACELGVQLESFSLGPSKKRQRINLEEIFIEETSKTTCTTNNDPDLARPIKQAKKLKKALKHLREIVGREGCGPINYIDLAKRISIPINLLELWQVSPDAAKEFRRLSTRINKKKVKRSPTELFSNSVNNDHPRSFTNTQSSSSERKAFRVPVVAQAEANGKIMKVALPKHISQADQGSEMNVISQGLVKALKLEKLCLGTRGFSGLTMNTADGGATELSHFVSFRIGVCGIWRRIDAFVRPVVKKGGELDLHLLLGLPWLHEVNANIFIRDSKIILGDSRLKEQIVEIQGPKFAASNSHKLILYPISSQVTFNQVNNSFPYEDSPELDTETDTSEASDDSSDSDLENELPKNISSVGSEN